MKVEKISIGTLGVVGTMEAMGMGTIGAMKNGKTSIRNFMKVEKYL